MYIYTVYMYIYIYVYICMHACADEFPLDYIHIGKQKSSCCVVLAAVSNTLPIGGHTVVPASIEGYKLYCNIHQKIDTPLVW